MVFFKYNFMACHKINREFYMEYQKSDQLSENEQMYLVTIAKLHEEGNDGLIPLSTLADTLSFLPVSVNQMIRKLADGGLLSYQPYKGVDFTSTGRKLVTRILRYRRLWEVFLVKHLKMSMEDADTLACRMEHITSNDVAERLAAFLGNPRVCYHGHPIPLLESDVNPPLRINLNQVQIGEKVNVNSVEADTAASSFLLDEGFSPGSEVTALGIGDNQAMLLEINDKQVYLTADLTERVIVEVMPAKIGLSNSIHQGQP
jgi:DtxR family Mn-dependent transcriptional regulator